MRYILHDHIGSANHGCEALVRTVSKLLGPGRTVLLSEAPEEDARYGVARPLVVQDVRPARSDVIRKSSPAFWSAYLRLKLLNDYTPLDVLPYRAALQTLTRDDILVSIGGDVYCYEDIQSAFGCTTSHGTMQAAAYCSAVRLNRSFFAVRLCYVTSPRLTASQRARHKRCTRCKAPGCETSPFARIPLSCWSRAVRRFRKCFSRTTPSASM